MCVGILLARVHLIDLWRDDSREVALAVETDGISGVSIGVV